MSDVRIFTDEEWDTGSLSFADGQKLLASLAETEILEDTRSIVASDGGLSAEKADHRALGWIAHLGIKGEVETYIFMPKGGEGYLAWFASRVVPE